MPQLPQPPETPEPPNQETPPPKSPNALEPGGSLNTLQQHLYRREESQTLKDRGSELQHLGIRRSAITTPERSFQQQSELFQELSRVKAAKRKRWFIIGGGVLGVLLIVGGATAGTFWYRARQNVTPEQIKTSIDAPQEFTTGEVITYTLHYSNQSFVDWQNVELTFTPPRGFRFEGSSREMVRSGKNFILSVGDLAAGQADSVEVTGQLIGEQNATLEATSELVITAKNFPSGRFAQQARASTTIASVPIDVSIDATDEAESGQRLLVTVKVRNNSTKELAGTYLKINPSAGIQLAPEDSQFTPGFSIVDSNWAIGTVEPHGETEYKLVMFVEGEPAERRTIEAEVGVTEGEEKIVQRLQTHVVTMIASALTLEHSYNDSSSTLTAQPEEEINGIIKYTNVGNTGLKNVVIKVAFEGQGINPASLRLPTGAYDPTTRTITWTTSTVPELATLQPGQSGELRYDFSILPAAEFPTGVENPKNNVLVATATIDSPDLITATGENRNIVSDRIVVSVATTMQLELSSFYDDGRLGLASTGPLPPKAGEQTTYTLRFRLGSALNDINEVSLVAVLPDGVKYTDKHYKTNGELTFNERTGELKWTLTTLEGLTGRTKPPEELHVQVAITPGEHQRGSEITFLNKAEVQGTDQFTDNTVSTRLIEFPTTETAVKGKGSVE